MDDLVVIILTLIVAAAGAFGQLKKKKKVPVENSNQESPESVWDIIQGKSDISGQTEVDEFSDNEGVEVVYEEGYQSEAKIENTNYEFKLKGDKGSEISKNELTKMPVKTKMKSKLTRDFSLRKAVIYSEILNRKYS